MKPIRTILLIVGLLVAGIAVNTAVAHPSLNYVESRIDSDHGNDHRDKHKDHKNKGKHKDKCHKHDGSKGKMHKHDLKQKDK